MEALAIATASSRKKASVHLASSSKKARMWLWRQAARKLVEQQGSKCAYGIEEQGSKSVPTAWAARKLECAYGIKQQGSKSEPVVLSSKEARVCLLRWAASMLDCVSMASSSKKVGVCFTLEQKAEAICIHEKDGKSTRALASQSLIIEGHLSKKARFSVHSLSGCYRQVCL